MKRSRVTWAALAALGVPFVTPASPAVAASYATCRTGVVSGDILVDF